MATQSVVLDANTWSDIETACSLSKDTEYVIQYMVDDENNDAVYSSGVSPDVLLIRSDTELPAEDDLGITFKFLEKGYITPITGETLYAKPEIKATLVITEA